MNKSLNNIAFLVLILITVGFPVKLFSGNVGISVIYDVKGNVMVEKKSWKKPQIATVGLTLTSDDKLNVAANASVKVYCSNQQIWTVTPGIYNVSSGCPSGNAVIRILNSNNDTLRPPGMKEEALSKLPYLITPRETSIITNTPQIRWNNVSGASSYTVKIDGVNWEMKTNNTEINYPGEPPLKAEERYRVTIEADNGTSSKSDAVVGFNVLNEQTKKTVLDAVKTIQQQPLSSEEKGLILAHLYRGYKLYGDAIDVLEALVKQGSQEVTVYQLLGDIYLDIGLPQLAKKPYEKGLNLATNTDNLSTQTEIQAGLGKAYRLLGNDSEAVQLLKKAKAGYINLGDEIKVQELDKEIKAILGV
ncbi:tetratricopeptide repeat protein [Crocosphaera sp. XPORK-15E]|uniref:tetratricopeptide repeat protein n=1 Tax=Crocosphaera sp. XPORK-15E TaxID=3110247 RepID=UPI002B212390|nr:tetratricopeptide repeat protein [Crocosphaera sp. XPORK-15E]MEA5535845.1 tetratricopeptide repeat protein [Crocosphaera sp. XPORK-15E]